MGGSSPAGGAARCVRPMRPADIPAVRSLFRTVFRPNAAICAAEFDRFFHAVFFENPHYDPAFGSIVHEDKAGEIDSAISILPIPYRVAGERVMGRMLCAFMARPGFSPRGAAELTLSLRPRGRNFCFSDSAAPVSARHFEATGGLTLPTHGLGWTRVFHAASYVAHHVASRKPALRSLGLPGVARMLDPLFPLPALRRSANGGTQARALEEDEAIALVRDLFAHYEAYPDWGHEDLRWLIRLAGENRPLGRLSLYAVDGAGGEPAGFFSYYGVEGGQAVVLSLLSLPGREAETVEAMLHHLKDCGHIAARGRADPRFLGALSQHPVMFFRLAANVCVATRHQPLIAAIDRNALFIGGLAGESWSRLVTDFY